ncbi:MAG: glycosyltransferase family 4 protein [Candidatus Omnitrophica bacterium]|nr:glycosyltransferase family 4 protein [Candidatus Omnitrophota bacterium]
MKILFLNHNLIGRGTFFRCMGFARELVKKGHHVDLWTCAKHPDLNGATFLEDGVRIWQTPRWGGLGRHDGGYAPIDNLARITQTFQGSWDVVHAFDHRPNVLLPWLILRRRLRDSGRDAPVLFAADWCDWWTAGGITTGRRRFSIIDRMERRIEEGSKRKADGVTVISSVLKQRALDSGVDENRLLLLPSGVNVDQFPVLDRASCRQTLGLPQDRIILGFVGFSLWDMGLLAEAFKYIHDRRPNAALLIIGGGVEEGAKKIFHRQFRVGEDVFLPGVAPFSEIPRYLCSCDIQLLPMNDAIANRARLPNKLCDYMASGRPVVASDVGESSRIINAFQIGETAKGGSRELAEACLHLIDHPEKSLELGKKARLAAETHFSYAHLTKLLCDFYMKILQGDVGK